MSSNIGDKYESLGVAGQGSYAVVLKCRNKDNGQLVAIKRFTEHEDNKPVKKLFLREAKMLKSLRHENLVNLLEIFRSHKRLYLVFEYVDYTVLNELESHPQGMCEENIKKILFQLLRAVDFIHGNNIIHRDVKPENILLSKSGVVKLCDFGFARTIAQPGEQYTEYVATRWYRAPELICTDTNYGRAVDVWAIGCVVAEMVEGQPLYPGKSDIDQLYRITKTFGRLTLKLATLFDHNPTYHDVTRPYFSEKQVVPLEQVLPKASPLVLDFIKQCLVLDAEHRSLSSQLLKHELFPKEFVQRLARELRANMLSDSQERVEIQKSADLREAKKKREKDAAEVEERKPRVEICDEPSAEMADHTCTVVPSTSSVDGTDAAAACSTMPPIRAHAEAGPATRSDETTGRKKEETLCLPDVTGTNAYSRKKRN